jgi:hypothetical protein
VFRTLLNDCSPLILPLINEVFGEHYTGREKIVFSPNEHFLNRQDGEEEERITDNSFKVLGAIPKKYHWECQCSPDNSMLVRFFEYDTQIALDEGEIVENVLTVTFPHSAVLFLRHTLSTPNTMTIKINTPGGDISYDIQVMKVGMYSLDEIFDKNLLFLIPFYIFSHESRFKEYAENEEKLSDLKAEYEKIKNRLEELAKSGMIDEYTRCTITDMSNKVLEHIAKNYKSVREGVKSVMGGKILDYEAKDILNRGKQEGRQEGKQEGRMELLFNLVSRKIFSVEDAAMEAQLTPEIFERKMREFTAHGKS